MLLYAIGPDQQAHNFNSLEMGALPEIRLLAELRVSSSAN
jgi:hypothetical protein